MREEIEQAWQEFAEVVIKSHVKCQTATGIAIAERLEQIAYSLDDIFNALEALTKK